MAGPFEYDVYLAYAHKDHAWVKKLALVLHDLGLRVFFDEWELTPGNSLTQASEQGAFHSASFVVIWSADSQQSHLGRTEAGIATRNAQEQDKIIVPVLLGPRSKDSQLPDGLSNVRWIDGNLGPDEVGLRIKQALNHRASSRPIDNSHAPSRKDQTDSIFTIAQRFFRAAGRSPQVKGLHLAVPEPAIFSRAEPPLPSDGFSAAEFIWTDNGQLGYLLHREELLPDFDQALDFLQARGLHLASLSERRMTTALAEGSAVRVLDDVTRRARGGDNLFGVKTAIDDPRQFFGRRESLARVGSMLARSEHVLLLGTRKSGKTSFLNILRQQLVSDRPVAWVDLQQFDPDSSTWPAKLFANILASFDGWGRAHFDKRWPFGGDSVVDGSTFTEQVHRRRAFLVSEDMNNRWVLVLDEMERLLPRPKDDEAAQRFIVAMGVLRALAQDQDRFLSLIVADLRPHVTRTNQLAVGTNPLFEFFGEVPLPPLSADNIEEMLRRVGRQMGIREFEDTVITEVIDGSGGHPRLARMLAEASTTVRSEPQSVTAADLAKGRRELRRSGRLARFLRENFWNPLDDDEKEMLRLAAVDQWAEPNSDHEYEVAATLHDLGLVVDAQIPIGELRRWIQDQQEPSNVAVG